MKRKVFENLALQTCVGYLVIAICINSCKKSEDAVSQDTTGIKHYTEVMGRPSNSSVTINILADQQTDFYWEYGTASGSYNMSSPSFSATKDMPLEADLVNLVPNTKYYYRTRYRSRGTSLFSAGPENTFHTPRAAGNTFTFAVEADPHLDSNSDTAAFSLTLKNIRTANPDFLIDLGDIFMSEKQPVINQQTITDRHILYRSFFDKVCPSVPLYLALGNHEGELGWLLNGSEGSLPVMATNTRKLYYPNPFPNSFYSGDTKSESLVGLREDYYSWEWGNALFIVLDPYWHTVSKPGWGWTLGTDQYNWFRNVLTTSKAKYKFVFCHNLVGGNGNDARGGVEFANLFEMGGYNTDGTWGFDANRAGWGNPIHTLMKENNVTVFFHGHDHFYGKQDKDGIVYQEVPQPSNRSLTNISAASYGYVEGVLMPGRGYIKVTVSGIDVKVEYIGTCLPSEENASQKNMGVKASYTIK